MIFVVIAAAYWAIRGFGPAAQAGFGVGSRVLQAIFLPAMAIAFAAAPVAGQNFGAGHLSRVRETFRSAAWMSCAAMAALGALCFWRAEFLVRLFTADAAVVAVGAGYLHIAAWNFVPSGLAFTTSSMFQALGNSWPSLISSGTRLITYVGPALWLGTHGRFELTHLWWMGVLTVTLQAIVALALLAQQFRQRLAPRPQLAPG